MNFTDAWRHDEAMETLWTNPDTDIALLAPHAGDIEFNTEFAAGQLHKLLRKEGYPPTTWMYYGFGENAFDEYHTESRRKPTALAVGGIRRAIVTRLPHASG